MEDVNKKISQEKNNRIHIFIGSDHAGYELKEYVSKYLEAQNYTVNNLGCNSTEAVDYPDFAFCVADCVRKSISINPLAKGILICGTGSGMAITANKVKDVRAVNCLTTEMAEMAVKHNNANILCIGARILQPNIVIEIVETFLNSEFEQGRHKLRVDKINTLTGM